MSATELTPELKGRIENYGRLALIGGAAAVALLLLLIFVPGTRAMVVRPYLAGFAFWFGLSLGGLMLTMVHHLTGGGWGIVIRRQLEAAALTMIPMAVLFVPIALALVLGGAADDVGTYLYRWTNTAWASGHEAVERKLGYLSTSFFLLRTAGYFAAYIGAAIVLNRLSRRQDTATDAGPTKTLQTISGPMLALTFLMTTFVTTDWLMSLEPDWYSTIYAPMLMVGWGVCTFSAAALLSSILVQRKEPALDGVAGPQQFNDLGNLMLAFTMLWAYMSFMQFLIIWCGNLAEEIPWYLRRTRGGWQAFGFILVAFHFFSPFFMLLMRPLKRQHQYLRLIAILILAVHLIDVTWLVLPSQFVDPLGAVSIPPLQILLTLLAAAGIGGVWLGAFARSYASKPIVPVQDPSWDSIRKSQQHQAHLAAVTAAPAHGG